MVTSKLRRQLQPQRAQRIRTLRQHFRHRPRHNFSKQNRKRINALRINLRIETIAGFGQSTIRTHRRSTEIRDLQCLDINPLRRRLRLQTNPPEFGARCTHHLHILRINRQRDIHILEAGRERGNIR